jgi:uncharacterized protein YbaR (Trm112 family)
MLDKNWLKMLVCPETQAPLALAADDLLGRLNAAIAAGKIRNRAGRPVKEPLQAGLVRADETLLYPILDEIPLLLVDEAIPLSQLGPPP